MRVDKETVSEFRHGHATVSTSRTQVTGVNFKTLKGVLIRAPGADDLSNGNTHVVFIGGPSVTANNDPNTGGIPLPPGNSIVIPVEDSGSLWVVSTGNAQDVSWAIL